jgi:amphi-Trp domain-containing protein
MGDHSKNKTKSEMSRDGAAEQIQTLVEQVRAGTVAIGDQRYAVPDQVQLVIEVKEDELEIEVKWRSAPSWRKLF